METILEYTDCRGVTLRVNREAGLIAGVRVLGLESKNGRTYPKETASRAASLYEGAKVNVNHPTGNASGPRDYQDRLGVLRNVRVDAGGLRADLQFNPKHALAEQLIWDAEHAPENVGLSHNIEAKTSRKGGKTVVEEILKVQSVDLVADPATTRGLFEQATGQPSKLEIKRGLVLDVAREIHMPEWAIPPLNGGLAYQHSREEVKVYLMEMHQIYLSKGHYDEEGRFIPPKPRRPKTMKQFVAAVIDGIDLEDKTKLEEAVIDDALDREGTAEFVRAITDGTPSRLAPKEDVTTEAESANKGWLDAITE